jgi:hypothetical protein
MIEKKNGSFNRNFSKSMSASKLVCMEKYCNECLRLNVNKVNLIKRHPVAAKTSSLKLYDFRCFLSTLELLQISECVVLLTFAAADERLEKVCNTRQNSSNRKTLEQIVTAFGK